MIYPPRTGSQPKRVVGSSPGTSGNDVSTVTLPLFDVESDSRVVVDGDADTREINQYPERIVFILTSIGIRAVR